MIQRKARMKLGSLLRDISKVRILVVGDIMLDRFIWGKVSRISPEAPVPVVVVDHENHLLGGAANVVNNIHSLGGKVSLCGVVGDDETGQTIIGLLKKIGIGTDGIFIEPGRQTTVKTRIFAHTQQVVRIDRETTDHLKTGTFRNLSEFLKEKIGGFDGVILSDYGKGLLTRELIRGTIRKAKQMEKVVLVDPKPKNFSFYKGATIVTPNTKEAAEASGISISDESSLKKAGRKLLRRLKCEALVVTRGDEGMAIFEPHQEFFVHTVAKEVYDVTGAGDTVIGTIAMALATGANVIDAVRLANYAAGIVVEKKGTATVHREELIKAIREHSVG
jgi:D-beta-D-heptose 7-phosphate kinase/D-beta-D-heptose 1-phosphate adenosyltransferase